MEQGHTRHPAGGEQAPPISGHIPWPGSACAPLFDNFPHPVLIANHRREVVYLNQAARRFFKGALQVGSPCPICPKLRGVLQGEPEGNQGTGCARPGEVNRLPIFFQVGQATQISCTVTVSPFGAPGEDPEGCLILLQEPEAPFEHPEVQLQMATLSSILDNFPTPFFMVDPNLVITHFNERMEKLTGFRRSEVVGKKTCGEVLNTPQCNTNDCVLRQVIEKHRAVTGERRVARNREGQDIQVTVSASIITDPHGRVIGGFEAVRDITPIVEAEKKLDLLTELTQEGVLMVDEEQRVVFANSRMAEILQQPREELLGKELREVLSPQHQKMAADLCRLAEQGGQPEVQFCSSLDQVLGDLGEPLVFETCMAVARLGTKTLTCFYLRDLTQRIKRERELQKANAFLRNIVQSSVDGIVVVDNKGVPLIFNEGAERILGYKAEEIVGNPENFRRLYPPKLAAEIMNLMHSDEFGPPGKLSTTQINFINKDGEAVPVNFSAAIIQEGGWEVGSVGIFSDLRELLKVHRELETTQSQLVQASKIASLGRLAAGVAHEINNPLAGILIYSELLQRDLGHDVPLRENVEVIIQQTMRCQEIVNRLLDFSRQTLGQKRLFDVNDLIQRSVALLQNQALFHNIQVLQVLDPRVPQIIGDPGQIQQVFTNLLLNATDAMEGQGEITVTTKPAPENDGVIVHFADTGPGIPPEIRDKIFEPFFTTKPPGKGTGLGLSIVYGVIQRHGGQITLDCPPGGGTTVTIRLPLDFPEPTPQMEIKLEG